MQYRIILYENVVEDISGMFIIFNFEIHVHKILNYEIKLIFDRNKS